MLLATLDASITIIAMPDIFRGIHLDPLVPANTFYLLWMILGYLVVTSVLIVSLGRLGDMVGRVRIYNLGFVIYTVASLLLAIDWMTGRAGATYLIVFRIVQGIGGACLLANAAAIITDAFPANQRGMALGINNIVGVSGMFIGLVLGGILAPIDWRLVFLISVPVGLFGTVWAYLQPARAAARRGRARDRLGGQRHVRARPDARSWSRSPTASGPPAATRPAGAARACWRCSAGAVVASSPSCVVERRVGRPDVPAAAVPHPRVHVRHAVDVPVGGRARRPDVHADHLAAGHLAAAARLRLHRDAAVGGHLHAAADGRDAAARARPRATCPTASARGRSRPAGCSLTALGFGAAHAAADRLRLPGVRRDPAADRASRWACSPRPTARR